MLDFIVIDPILALIFRLLLALVFASAVVHKLVEPRSFCEAVADYQLLPGILVTPFAAGFIVVECVTVIALMFPATTLHGSLFACGLLLVYTIAISCNLLRGRTSINCGCMGPAHVQELNGWLLLRNLPLLAIALVSGFPAYDRSLVVWDYATVIFAVMALGMLYVTMNHLLVNGPRLRALLVRHD